MARHISVTYVPSDVASIYAGKSRAPAAIKEAGLVTKLQKASYNVSEREALPTPVSWSSAPVGPNGAKHEEVVVEICRRVKDTVASALRDPAATSTPPFTLVIGGECLMVPAIMSALAHHYQGKRVGLMYVDADCDMYLPHEPDSSGNVASMTGANLTLRPGTLESMKQFSRPCASSPTGSTAVVDSSSMVFFGLNHASQGTRPAHLAYLLNEHFRVFTNTGVAADAAGSAEKALKWIEERMDFIHVHLDVDAIDPGRFPLCNLANYTGVTFEQIMTAMKIFLKSPKTVGLSVAEVNPDHDPGLLMTNSLVDELVAGLGDRVQ